MPMRNNRVMEFLDFSGTLSTMKEDGYKNTLAVTALIELLAEKGIITKEDFSGKTQELECADLAGIVAQCRKSTRQ